MSCVTPLHQPPLRLCAPAHPLTLVPFTHPSPRTRCSFAPWCGVCKAIGPEFARAAGLAATALPSVAFGAVNSDTSPELTEALGVTTFPRFILYRSGEAEPFPMVATGEAFVAGVARVLGMPGADALSPAKVFEEDGSGAGSLATWLFWRGREGGRLESTLVLYAPPVEGCTGSAATDSAAAEAAGGADSGTCANPAAGGGAEAAARYEAAFNAAAGELMKDATLRFAIVRSVSAMSEFEVPLTAPSLVFYKDHDEGRAEYSGAITPEAITQWVRTQNVPLVTFVTHKTLTRVRAEARTLALLFLEESQTDHLPTLTRAMEALREAVYALEAEGLVTRGEFTLGVTNGGKYASWMEHYGMRAGLLPALGAEVVEGERRYTMGGEVGAAWALEAVCGEAAVADVGVKGKWRVVLSHACAREAVEAAIERVRAELVEAGEAEEAAALSPKVNDPKERFPQPLYASALGLPVEAVSAWLRKLLTKQLDVGYAA